MSSTVVLAAMPLLLALTSAFLWMRHLSDRNTQFVVCGGLVTTGVLLLIGFPGAVAGTTTQLSLPNPLPGVASGLAATSSGYSVLGLSLLAGMVVTLNGLHSRSAAWLMLGLTGVCLACLGVGMLGLVVGVELVWLAIFAHAQADSEKSISAERWLGLVVLQIGAGALLASVAWAQVQAHTTAFNAMPAASAARCAMGWALAIVLMAISGGLGRGDNARPCDLGWVTALLSPMVVINLIRLNQVSPHQTTQAAVMLVAGGVVCGLLGAVRAITATAAVSAIRWIWIATATPVLILGGLQIVGTDVAFTVAAGSFMFSGILLVVAAHFLAGPYVRMACLLAACGFPTGIALTGSAASVAALIHHDPSAALGWLLVVVSVGTFLAAIKVGITSTRESATPGSRSVALPIALLVLSISAAGSLVPGLWTSSLSGWLLDQDGGTAPLMTITLANGTVWPGGWMALVALLLIAAVVSAGVVAGWRTPGLMLSKPAEDSRSGLTAWEHLLRPARVLVEAGSRLDQWLALEPRFGTILVSGALALSVFR